MRAKAYVVGVCSGAVLAANWRPLVKQSIKVGVRGGASLRRMAMRSVEQLSDMTHEAMWEMSSSEVPPDAGTPTVDGAVNGGRAKRGTNESADANTAAPVGQAVRNGKGTGASRTVTTRS